MYKSPLEKLTVADVWSPTKNAPIREAARLAYRLARIKSQIKWAPDHVDLDDIDPAKFAPGGDYYNAPETVAHFEAAKQFQKIGHLDLILSTCVWSRKAQCTPLSIRLQARKDAKWFSQVFGS